MVFSLLAVEDPSFLPLGLAAVKMQAEMLGHWQPFPPCMEGAWLQRGVRPTHRDRQERELSGSPRDSGAHSSPRSPVSCPPAFPALEPRASCFRPVPAWLDFNALYLKGPKHHVSGGRYDNGDQVPTQRWLGGSVQGMATSHGRQDILDDSKFIYNSRFGGLLEKLDLGAESPFSWGAGAGTWLPP